MTVEANVRGMIYMTKFLNGVISDMICGNKGLIKGNNVCAVCSLLFAACRSKIKPT